MSSEVTLRPIHKVRLNNLKRVIDSKFSGNASQCARAIAKSHTYMWQLMRGYRTIGETSARHIEQALKLGENALDDRVMKKSTALVQQLGDGNTRNFKVVPLLGVDDLFAKSAKDTEVCPDADCGDKVFCVVASEAMEGDTAEVRAGDKLFVDRDAPLKAGKLYVVVLKKTKSAMVLKSLARGTGWEFATTNSEDRREKRIFGESDVRMVGRVVITLRKL